MATLKSETWTGANGDPWPAQWDTATKTVGSAATIQSNRGRLATSTAGGYSDYIYADLGAVAADLLITGDIHVTNIGEHFFYIMFRSDPSFANRFYMQFNFSSGFGIIHLGRHDFDTPTILQSVAQEFAVSDVVHFKIQAQGTYISAKYWINGASEPANPQFESTQTAYVANTGVKLLDFGGAAAGGYTTELDDFVLQTVDAGLVVGSSTGPVGLGYVGAQDVVPVTVSVDAAAAVSAGAAENATTTRTGNGAAAIAAGVGAGNSATGSVGATAGSGAGVGAANDATTATSAAASAGNALSAGAANNATVTATTAAGNALSAGAANTAQGSVKPSAGAGAGVGASNEATVTRTGNGNAGNALGAGAANAATVTNTPPQAAVATGAGTANNATVTATGPRPSAATGAGAANTTTSTVSTSSGAGTGAGAGNSAVGALSIGASTATSAGTAYDATVSTVIFTEATAEAALATGAASDATGAAANTANAGVATGIGAAWSIDLAPDPDPTTKTVRPRGSTVTLYKNYRS